MLYLASSYSHPDPDVRQRRYELACRAAADLMRAGYLVFSPIAHSHGIALHGGMEGAWEDWQAQDLAMLDKASALVILPCDGWVGSRGVQAEAAHAAHGGLPIVVMDPVDAPGSTSIRLVPLATYMQHPDLAGRWPLLSQGNPHRIHDGLNAARLPRLPR